MGIHVQQPRYQTGIPGPYGVQIIHPYLTESTREEEIYSRSEDLRLVTATTYYVSLHNLILGVIRLIRSEISSVT